MCDSQEGRDVVSYHGNRLCLESASCVPVTHQQVTRQISQFFTCLCLTLLLQEQLAPTHNILALMSSLGIYNQRTLKAQIPNWMLLYAPKNDNKIENICYLCLNLTPTCCNLRALSVYRCTYRNILIQLPAVWPIIACMMFTLQSLACFSGQTGHFNVDVIYMSCSSPLKFKYHIFRIVSKPLYLIWGLSLQRTWVSAPHLFFIYQDTQHFYGFTPIPQNHGKICHLL